MKEYLGALIFDGDDTLWPIQAVYDEAEQRFCDLMEEQGFDRRFAKYVLTEIDMMNAKHLGFSRSRYSKSMKEAYQVLCDLYAQPINRAVLEEVRNIGVSVFSHRPNLMPGAKEVLEQLVDSYHLYLYTGGIRPVQREKIKVLGIAKYFKKVYVPVRKNEAELRRILDEQKLDVESTWMIGNSPKSDINPALRLGLRCIWIPCRTWNYDIEELLPGQVWKVHALTEIPSVLAEVDNLCWIGGVYDLSLRFHSS